MERENGLLYRIFGETFSNVIFRVGIGGKETGFLLIRWIIHTRTHTYTYTLAALYVRRSLFDAIHGL